MRASSVLIITLLTVIAVFLGILAYGVVFRPQVSAGELFGGGGGASGDYIALTSSDSRGRSLLYLLDTGQESMVVYKLHDDSKLYPVSVRVFGQDVQYAKALMHSAKYKGERSGITPGHRDFRPATMVKRIEEIERKFQEAEEKASRDGKKRGR